jgi:hypothetical protein
MMSKKQCKNDPTFSFTGKESSPLGLGYSASAEQVGHIMEGRDQTMWMVGMKNGVKVWNRVPTEIAAAAFPLEKEAPVLAEAPAKKKAVRKATKKAPVEEENAEPKAANVEPTANVEPQAEEPKEEPKPAPKKRVTKKKVAAEEPGKDAAPVEEAAKPKKKPTSFNLFMSARLKEMAAEDPGMSHKDKFSKAATEWREMDDAAKKAFLEKIGA